MSKTPKDKAIEKLKWIASGAVDLVTNDEAEAIATAIIEALPVEWIDSESEPEVGDVIEYYYDPCDLRATIYDGDTNWLKVQSYWRIIQRKNRPAINVDEINLSKVE